MTVKARPNIFLITIDSLRADHCQFLGYSKRTTPFLSSIVRDSLVFLNFYASSIPTFFAFPVIMTGKKPFLLGETLGIPEDVQTIAEVLKKEGYTTLAFVANNPALYREFGYNRGFDIFNEFREYTRQGVAHQIKKAVRNMLPTMAQRLIKACLTMPKILPDAFTVTSKVISTLCNLGNRYAPPFFCWIHYMDVHFPYNGYRYFKKINGWKPSRYLMRTGIDEWGLNLTKPPHLLQLEEIITYREVIKGLYDGAIRFIDSEIRRLISHISKLFRNNENLFVITSDHGEAFAEHSYIFHEPWGVHNQLIKVPLLIFHTRGAIRGVVERFKTHEDLFNIVLSLATGSELGNTDRDYVIIETLYGCVNPHFEIFDSRTKIKNPKKLISVIMRDYKYIICEEAGIEELYNITADPAERFNLLEYKKKLSRDLAREMLETYKNWEKEREKERIKTKRASLATKIARLKTNEAFR